MKRRNRPILIAVMCCAAVLTAVFAALAYSSVTDGITNTFSIGNVRIKLTETEYPGNTVSGIVPNSETAKNPQINNVGVNSAFVFLKVTVPKKEVTVADAYGNCSEKTLQEIFYLKTSENDIDITENSFSDCWSELESYAEESSETKTYVFGYKNALGSFRATEPLFDKIQLKNIIEQEIDPEELQEIKIEAYAVQSDNIPGIDKTDDLSADELEQIYRIIENK